MGVFKTKVNVGDIGSLDMTEIPSQRLTGQFGSEVGWTTPLKIAIVGAGIGGLTAAIGLRRNGHRVDIYEQSHFAGEVGAAVHLAPNANGILRRWGILAEDIGGNLMSGLVERTSDGQIRQDIDLTIPNKRWQHPWHLVHRVNLHNRLKQLATSDVGIGVPAKLHTACKVVAVDTEKGYLTLQDGSKVKADLIIGADGIYSMTRKYIQDARLFSSGKAAFRFLIPRREADADPFTAPLVERKDTLSMWFSHDRRVVMYPCNDNELLNFVCIHPESESQVGESDGWCFLFRTEWNKQGSIEQLLKIYQTFNPALKALMSKADKTKIHVWQLLDMTKLPTWVSGKLVLLGDSAHPFTPHQGQGAGQAIEDAAALTTVLPTGTTPSEIPARLKLYEEIRYERAHVIQEYSRLAGQDWVKGKPTVDMMAYTNYNFGHDAIDHAQTIFQRHLWSESHPWPTLPSPFGPFPISTPEGSPKYRLYLPDNPHHTCPHFITTATITFKTSATYLETLFPTTSLKFSQPGTVATARFIAKHFSFPDGSESAQLGLYIPNVHVVDPDGSHKYGTYLPMLLTSTTSDDSPHPHGPRVNCEVSLAHDTKTRECRIVASSGGISFIEITISGLIERDAAPDEGIANTERHDPVFEYSVRNDVQDGDAKEAEGDNDEKTSNTWSFQKQEKAECGMNLAVADRRRSMTVPDGAERGVEVKMQGRSWEELPGLHHVARVLAGIPVLGVLEGSVEVVEREVS